MNSALTRKNLPFEKYQRPRNHSIVTGAAGVAQCLVPGRQRIPVRSFMVQNDLTNGALIRVGANVSLTLGIGLDPGAAWVFSVDESGIMTSNREPTPENWAINQQFQGNRNIPFNQSVRLYLDIADFNVVSGANTQLVQIVYFTLTQ